MKLVLQLCAVLTVSLLSVRASFADSSSNSKAAMNEPQAGNSDAASADTRLAAKSEAAALTSAPTPQQRSGATAAGGGGDEASKWMPMPATSGTTGLFTVESGQTLPKKGFSFSTGVNKFERQPGSVSVLNVGLSFGVGVNDWLTFYLQFDPHRHLHLGAPGELSLNTPITNPLFPGTFYRRLTNFPGSQPGYVEDYPFASHDGGGVGEVALGFKVGLLSEQRGHPVSLSVRNDFTIPTRTSLTDLLDNGTQTGQFNYAFTVALSKTCRWLMLAGNGGYRFTRDPRANGQHLLNQADRVAVGAGALLFPRSRVQLMTEYTGVIFVGAATPNTTFGARDPVDGVWGLRLYASKHMAFDAGYRYMLNLRDKDDRHGFVIKVGVVY